MSDLNRSIVIQKNISFMKEWPRKEEASEMTNDWGALKEDELAVARDDEEVTEVPDLITLFGPPLN